MFIEIVRYADLHRDGVRDLIVPIQQDEFGIPITYQQQFDLHDVDGYYRKGKGEFWVALDDDRLVGSIALIDIGGGQAALPKMFVKRDYRGGRRGSRASCCSVSSTMREGPGSAKSISGPRRPFSQRIASTRRPAYG